MIMSSYFTVQYLHQKMIRIYADIVQNHTLPVFPNFWRAVYIYIYIYAHILFSRFVLQFQEGQMYKWDSSLKLTTYIVYTLHILYERWYNSVSFLVA